MMPFMGDTLLLKTELEQRIQEELYKISAEPHPVFHYDRNTIE